MKTLVECLGIQPGITTFIGGGGKTSAIFQVARELMAQNKRVIVTTTTKMYEPTPEQMETVCINPTDAQVKEHMDRIGAIVIAGGRTADKITSVTQEDLGRMRPYADYILVEGDGAKRLPLKVPAAHEPVIPKDSTKVVIVIGMKCFAQPLETVCFRAELAQQLVGVPKSTKVTGTILRQIIMHPYGLQKGIGQRQQVLLINQMDHMQKPQQIRDIIETLRESYPYPMVVGAIAQQEWQEV